MRISDWSSDVCSSDLCFLCPQLFLPLCVRGVLRSFLAASNATFRDLKILLRRSDVIGAVDRSGRSALLENFSLGICDAYLFFILFSAQGICDAIAVHSFTTQYPQSFT